MNPVRLGALGRRRGDGAVRDNLEYGMDARHLEGLERFYRLSFEAGLVDRLSPLEFATPP